jgi:bifunctional DNA-binding transcriptional regulator/antitoxin component of YhaV-PrlF toxin-antitoxin module
MYNDYETLIRKGGAFEMLFKYGTRKIVSTPKEQFFVYLPKELIEAFRFKKGEKLQVTYDSTEKQIKLQRYEAEIIMED